MAKAADTSGRSAADRDLAIRQIVNGAVASTEIVDILSAAGLSSPDISILSDEFLAEIAQMEKKNLALEALKKLLNDEIKSRSRSNVIETRKFSDRLDEAISRYHTNAISTVEVLQELIALAKEVREARSRGEETGRRRCVAASLSAQQPSRATLCHHRISFPVRDAAARRGNRRRC